jgi:hypothetical protein
MPHDDHTPGRDWVLVTSGDHRASRAAVAVVRALNAAGYAAAVTVSGGASLASASRHCRRRVEVPSVAADPDGYARAVRGELERFPYLTVLPITEPVLLALSLPVRHLIDKVECAKGAARAGIPVPRSEIFTSAQQLRDRAEGLDYPVVIKPDIKRQLAFCAKNAHDVRSAMLSEGRFIVQPYLDDDLHGVLGLMWRGTLVAAAHMRYLRTWPLPCGTVAAAETMSVDAELERRLEILMAGYDGLFHADFAGPHLLDLNPRAHATLPLALAAGVNLVGMYCDLVRGESIRPTRVRPGYFYRWIEGDVRSVATSVREGHMSVLSAIGALAPRIGAAHSFEALRDPGPLIARVAQIATRLAHSKVSARLGPLFPKAERPPPGIH